MSEEQTAFTHHSVLIMETTRILLVRHGQSQGNVERRFGGHSPTPLSELGFKQAEATARALAVATGLEVNRTNALREHSVGRMEGLTFEAAAEAYPEEYGALLRRDFEH